MWRVCEFWSAINRKNDGREEILFAACLNGFSVGPLKYLVWWYVSGPTRIQVRTYKQKKEKKKKATKSYQQSTRSRLVVCRLLCFLANC